MIAPAIGSRPARKLSLSLSMDHSGGPLSYLEMGKKGDPCVVFVHGFGANLLTWQLCLVPLATRFRVIAIDLPGHGRSTLDVGDGTLSRMTEWLAETLDVLDVPQAHLIAHSMGAKIVLAFAMRQAERVLSLGLISPAGLGGHFNHHVIEQFLSEPSYASAEGTARQLLGPRGDNLIQGLTGSLYDAAGDQHRNRALRKLFDQAKGCGGAAPPEGFDFGQLSCPIKILWGDQDRIIPLPASERLPPIQRIAGAGHLPHMEAPETVVSALKDFLI